MGKTLRKIDDEDDLYTDLTETQEKLLDFLEDCIVKNGYPPTRPEIAAHFGWKSPYNAAAYQLQKLASKGRIQLIPNVARGIKLVTAP